MADQRDLVLRPSRGEALNFARVGFDLDWRRVDRRAHRLFAAHLTQAADAEARGAILRAGLEWKKYFRQAALFEEVQACCRRKARELKKTNCARGRRLSGAVALACTSQGRRAQKVIDQLSKGLREWESASLCG